MFEVMRVIFVADDFHLNEIITTELIQAKWQIERNEWTYNDSTTKGGKIKLNIFQLPVARFFVYYFDFLMAQIYLIVNVKCEIWKLNSSQKIFLEILWYASHSSTCSEHEIFFFCK